VATIAMPTSNFESLTILYMHFQYIEVLDSAHLQGNCGASSNVTLVKELVRSTSGRVEYPPLRPFQCVLVVDKPFLHNTNAAQLWLDNLYVAVTRTRVQPELSIIRHGGFSIEQNQVGGKSLFITSSTFVGEGRGSSRAILSLDNSAGLLIEGVTQSFPTVALT
jgi:hypothetical protein